MGRSPKAPLSPQEVAALQTLKQNPRELSHHRQNLLLSMGLALGEGEELKLSHGRPGTTGGRAGSNR